MTQVLIYSIQSEHVLNFLNGRKTIEVRKRDLPQWAKEKIDRGEVVEGYMYCTKGKPYLFTSYATNEDGYTYIDGYGLTKLSYEPRILNGLVVVKFEVSGTTKYVDCSDCTNTENGYECENDFMYLLSVDPILRKATCLEADEIEAYGNGADLYAHHFTNIQPIEPMGLREFTATTIRDDAIIEKDMGGNEYFYYKDRMAWRFYFGRLSRPPQSFMTAWVKGE